MKVFTILLTITLPACASAAVRYVPISYQYRDDVKNHKLVLNYENKEKKTVCIDASNWPSKTGIIDNSGEEIFIEVDEKKFFLAAEQDYCPSCITKVPPKTNIFAVLDYGNFKLPKELYNSPKRLFLRSVGFICKK